MRTFRPWLLALAASLLLAACGFQLRGAQTLPFKSIYVAVADSSEFGARLKRAVRSSNSTTLAASPAEAEAVFSVTQDTMEKFVLAVNNSGQAREYELRYRFAYTLTDAQGRTLATPTTLTQQRVVTVNPAVAQEVLSKQQEEELLRQDMQRDLVQQVMRRLATTKPLPPAVDSSK
ncbi:lipoprotein B precursor [Oryzomicrobium terrae]|uniref:LPS-assembly lipoprotein LptE n=1 Tax=Oryzomicrobium terrae TaxID=1735038 RepID=A0A5C1EBS2_9RHOO|nr:LPS assembly lipoprotein LptE [Oryzomicrobium terrae]QEL66144.1 lipoprotein B precursor [Oryzomicrobium terrae]